MISAYFSHSRHFASRDEMLCPCRAYEDCIGRSHGLIFTTIMRCGTGMQACHFAQYFVSYAGWPLILDFQRRRSFDYYDI